MNPIPISWCLGGAAAAALVGAWGGWTVRDWKRDSEVLAGIEKATELVNEQLATIDAAAQAYEQEREDARVQTNVRESTIREIYRDRPVPADCAVGDDVRGVLNDAVRSANARAAGEPAPGVSATAGGAGSADRP
ncbi:hypothetical protein [Novosphingobium pentaromativorans]|uniref:Uncharacterized protein n=1 Tax=Novosphingobium pentaromativorans US6-1 TaxID=1088721 RepID=G6E7L9_9SPHN|nr:hypothetical protein [Novosphingobium pentaromativorans]AIT81584.1 hypothetical protein JI59_18315 [Novosphingobium pentaromativorans US6-1]EHJ62842.1 hypothetical protein NSU_0354 [Novosphingobium pentaromativorans US6-1]